MEARFLTTLARLGDPPKAGKLVRMREGHQSGHLELSGWNPGPQEVRAGVPGQGASPPFSIRVDWLLALSASVPGTELSLGAW